MLWQCRWYQGLKMSFQDKPRSPHPFMGGSMSRFFMAYENIPVNSKTKSRVDKFRFDMKQKIKFRSYSEVINYLLNNLRDGKKKNL